MPTAVLHDYPRSSAAYRVRIALNLKGIEYESRTVNLLDGAQRSDDYRSVNPLGLVPTLEIDGQRLTQSMAIIGYLDQRHPVPPLLPTGAVRRAQVLAAALTIACDIHPLNNLRVLKYLTGTLEVDEEAKDDWYRHWITEGLTALEAETAPGAGAFLFGAGPTIADVCLVPQLYNARRFDVPLDAYPTLLRADENAAKIDAFRKAHPEEQVQ